MPGLSYEAAAADGKPALTFCCSSGNDLYRVLVDSGCECSRVETPRTAVERARPGSVVLILADGYPGKLTEVPASVFDHATEKGLRLYIEFPASIPGLELGEPRQTQWERCVVASEVFGESLAKLRILNISGCRFVPVAAREAHLVVARVAGYDTAVYRISESSHPVLFSVGRDLLVATTKLSGFVTGRYAPCAAWTVVWERSILRPTSSVTSGRIGRRATSRFSTRRYQA